jgi:NOL1/NOP2/sun family putative RNA methylase
MRLNEKMAQTFNRYRDIIPDYDGFLTALEQPLPVAIRANTLKISPGPFRDFMTNQGYKLEPVRGIEEAFLLHGVEAPGATLEYFLGYYHIQGLTSMLPAKILDPRRGEIILDLCAAPGGKTTHIAQLMGDHGLVVANDFKPERTHVLRSHIDRLGILSVLVCCYHGQAFPLRRKFDRILLDPPCSAEGTYRAGLPPLLSENPKVARHLVRVQKELLRQSLAVLRPGGTLVYSTCTYAPEENEAVVNEALKDGEAELLPISLPFPHSKGLTSWNDESYQPDMVKAVRFYPHQVNSWGFFIAHLRKRS